jgi:uncharacterized Fe-S center protein
VSSSVLFASAYARKLEANATLPAKFGRLIERSGLKEMLSGKTVAIKMHLGGGLGYTTIHPLFVRTLVDAIKESAHGVFITDSPGSVMSAKSRGYTEETIGAPIVPTTGLFDKYFYSKPVEYKTLKEVQVAGHIHDADAMIDFSHVKGHGACGYGGACKNLAMGCVTAQTRSDIHRLEGGFTWNSELCTHCEMCIQACRANRHNANRFSEGGTYEIFYHNCAFCQHCVNACPQGAITLNESAFEDFQTGMALATKAVLDTFEPGSVYFINLLTNITILCDCWGFSTPPIVPDIGLMASSDIVAIERACLDAIKLENFQEQGLPEGRQLGDGKHLLEKIHQKDPFVQIRKLEGLGLGTQEYEVTEIE